MLFHILMHITHCHAVHASINPPPYHIPRGGFAIPGPRAFLPVWNPGHVSLNPPPVGGHALPPHMPLHH